MCFRRYWFNNSVTYRTNKYPHCYAGIVKPSGAIWGGFGKDDGTVRPVFGGFGKYDGTVRPVFGGFGKYDGTVRPIWGNGSDRKERLTKAGYDYTAIQKIVNSMSTGNTGKKSNETIAREVIQGKWGNGTDRKNRLASAGYDYKEIQRIVNRLL